MSIGITARLHCDECGRVYQEPSEAAEDAVTATALVITGLSVLAIAGWTDYRQARDQHRRSNQ